MTTQKSLWMGVMLFCCLFATPAAGRAADDHIVIGAVEDVVLMPGHITLPARIDTGAATTSLDARDLVVRDGVAEFRLPPPNGGRQFRLPVAAWKEVKSAAGRQRRPVVLLDICLGSRVLHIEANLMDRSRMQYPLLIGRNILEKGFLVDVRKTGLLPPCCGEPGGP